MAISYTSDWNMPSRYISTSNGNRTVFVMHDWALKARTATSLLVNVVWTSWVRWRCVDPGGSHSSAGRKGPSSSKALEQKVKGTTDPLGAGKQYRLRDQQDQVLNGESQCHLLKRRKEPVWLGIWRKGGWAEKFWGCNCRSNKSNKQTCRNFDF